VAFVLGRESVPLQGLRQNQLKALSSHSPASLLMTEPALLRVAYADSREPVPTELLAGFSFADPITQPRLLSLPLPVLSHPGMYEYWHVDAPIHSGVEAGVHFAEGGGWLFAWLEIADPNATTIETAATEAYRRMAEFQQRHSAHHVLRIWNYLRDINQGTGDQERYRLFCNGRAVGMGNAFGNAGYPAATAIGHQDPHRGLIVYWLAAVQNGQRVENPRQVSAWCYPHNYGPTPPGFARALRLPNNLGLAISGTAAVVGHASTHPRNMAAQLHETFTNLDHLHQAAGYTKSLPAGSLLKAYVRHPQDANAVAKAIRQRYGAALPSLILQGDICRSELLVELDGWYLH